MTTCLPAKDAQPIPDRSEFDTPQRCTGNGKGNGSTEVGRGRPIVNLFRRVQQGDAFSNYRPQEIQSTISPCSMVTLTAFVVSVDLQWPNDSKSTVL